MLQYRQYIQNPSPDEAKWRHFFEVVFRCGIYFQNTPPVEDNEDNLILTWNPGMNKLEVFSPFDEFEKNQAGRIQIVPIRILTVTFLFVLISGFY